MFSPPEDRGLLVARPTLWLPDRKVVPARMAPAPGSPQVPARKAAALPAISRVGSATAAATTITLPTHASGDVIVMIAHRQNTTPPSVPGGWTTIDSSGASSISMVLAWLLADSASETSGTWTNAQRLIAIVYRNLYTSSPIGNTVGPSTSSGGSMQTGALSLTSGHANRNWILFAGCVASGSNWGSSPPSITGLTVVPDLGATAAAWDSNGPRSTDYAGQTGLYTAATTRTFGIELRAA